MQIRVAIYELRVFRFWILDFGFRMWDWKGYRFQVLGVWNDADL